MGLINNVVAQISSYHAKYGDKDSEIHSDLQPKLYSSTVPVETCKSIDEVVQSVSKMFRNVKDGQNFKVQLVLREGVFELSLGCCEVYHSRSTASEQDSSLGIKKLLLSQEFFENTIKVQDKSDPMLKGFDYSVSECHFNSHGDSDEYIKLKTGTNMILSNSFREITQGATNSIKHMAIIDVSKVSEISGHVAAVMWVMPREKSVELTYKLCASLANQLRERYPPSKAEHDALIYKPIFDAISEQFDPISATRLINGFTRLSFLKQKNCQTFSQVIADVASKKRIWYSATLPLEIDDPVQQLYDEFISKFQDDAKPEESPLYREEAMYDSLVTEASASELLMKYVEKYPAAFPNQDFFKGIRDQSKIFDHLLELTKKLCIVTNRQLSDPDILGDLSNQITIIEDKRKPLQLIADTPEK